MCWRRIDEALFDFGSPTSLGVFRALMGGCITLSLLFLASDFETWFTEAGLIPHSAAQAWGEGYLRVALLQLSDSPAFAGLVLFFAILAGALTTVGLYTRVASIALALLLVSIHHRVPFVLNSGDTLMRVCAIFLAVAPCGAAFSLDRLRTGSPPEPISLWPQRVLQFQMAIVYGTTLWLKLRGEVWRDGTAAYYPTQLPDLARFPMPAFVDQPPLVQIATWGTLGIELSLCTLVFAKSLRKWALLAGLFLHTIIEYRFVIPLFALAMCSLYVTFYSGEEIEAWWGRLCQRMTHGGSSS